MSGLGKEGSESPTEFKQTWAGQLADYVTAMAYGPKGKSWAATSAAGEVMLFRPEGAGFAGVALTVASALPAAVNCVGFSPDGKFLAAGGQAGRVWVWNVATHTLIAQLDYPRAWIDHLAWSPTHNQLAFSVGKAVQVWDAQTQATTALNFGASSVLDLAWHPLGSHLAVGGYQGLQVWTARDWAAAPVALEMPTAALSIGWSAGGKYIGSGNMDCTLALWEWGNPSPWQMRGFPGKIGQIAWSGPGADLLATASLDGVVLWEPQADESWGNTVLNGHVGKVQALGFGPGGLLATGGEDGFVGLWSREGKLERALPIGEPVSCLAWHPIGRRLVVGGQGGMLMVWSGVSKGRGFG